MRKIMNTELKRLQTTSIRIQDARVQTKNNLSGPWDQNPTAWSPKKNNNINNNINMKVFLSFVKQKAL